MFQAAKDAVTSKAAQAYLNKTFARYGEVERVKLDSRERTLEIVLHLHGESEPITASVGRYTIHEVGEKKYVEVADCTCSREWLQNLIEDFAHKRRIELPPWAVAAL